ncbi:DUF5131 family protein [Oleiharenicola sp. Vm1]|uniref:DUF5131 family protein n=1 Tax=Oleiharenicola sp. Vm1 TaxID=3398393 RepID=UPI0039F541BE
MGKGTGIQWTDDTDNVIVVKGGGWWCRKLSEGCFGCFAAELNQNLFYGGNRLAYSGPPPPLVLRTDLLDGWSRQTRPRLHFVASMTDVFGDWVDRKWQLAMFDAMTAAPKQIFQVLTKRPGIFADAAIEWCALRGRDSLPDNIWPGTSVENQKRADERREAFRRIPARYKFVSYEPALDRVQWDGWEFVSQIISGGESGKRARPSHQAWHRETRDWCAKHHVAFFFKQWGEFLPEDQVDAEGQKSCASNWTSRVHTWEDESHSTRIGKHQAGGMLDGRAHLDFPAFDHPALSKRPKVAA